MVNTFHEEGEESSSPSGFNNSTKRGYMLDDSGNGAEGFIGKPSQGYEDETYVYEPKLAYEDSSMWKKWSNRSGIVGWVVGKPKMAASIPQDPLSPQVRKINAFSVFFRLFFLTIGMIIVTVSAMWLIFGLTFMPTVKVAGKFYLVDSASWTQGEAPNGVYAYASAGAMQRSIGYKLENLVPYKDSGGSVVKIVDKTNDGVYLAVCVSGACEAGKPPEIPLAEYVITVPVENVVGKISAQVGLIFLKKYENGNTPPVDTEAVDAGSTP